MTKKFNPSMLLTLFAVLSFCDAKVVTEDVPRNLLEESIFITCGMFNQRCCKGKFCAPYDPDELFFMTCNAMQQCIRCGDHGGQCCDNEKCGKELYCDRGICQTCGSSGESCCDGMKCRPSHACVGDSECMLCGNKGEVCCEGMKCANGHVCNQNAICAECGDKNEPCCEGMKCGMDLVCTHTGKCVDCGGYGEPCCDGMKCENDNPLVCTIDGCMSCGGADEPCCSGEGPPCRKTELTCGDSPVSIPLKCGSDGFCEVPDNFPHKQEK